MASPTAFTQEFCESFLGQGFCGLTDMFEYAHAADSKSSSSAPRTSTESQSAVASQHGLIDMLYNKTCDVGFEEESKTFPFFSPTTTCSSPDELLSVTLPVSSTAAMLQDSSPDSLTSVEEDAFIGYVSKTLDAQSHNSHKRKQAEEKADQASTESSCSGWKQPEGLSEGILGTIPPTREEKHRPDALLSVEEEESDEKDGEERDDDSDDERSGRDKDRKGDDDSSGKSKKARLTWSPELHTKFIEAISVLGLNNAVPKSILQHMNVPGLSRENVASHLQKYRMAVKRQHHQQQQVASAAANSAAHNNAIFMSSMAAVAAAAASGYPSPHAAYLAAAAASPFMSLNPAIRDHALRAASMQSMLMNPGSNPMAALPFYPPRQAPGGPPYHPPGQPRGPNRPGFWQGQPPSSGSDPAGDPSRLDPILEAGSSAHGSHVYEGSVHGRSTYGDGSDAGSSTHGGHVYARDPYSGDQPGGSTRGGDRYLEAQAGGSLRGGEYPHHVDSTCSSAGGSLRAGSAYPTGAAEPGGSLRGENVFAPGGSIHRKQGQGQGQGQGVTSLGTSPISSPRTGSGASSNAARDVAGPGAGPVQPSLRDVTAMAYRDPAGNDPGGSVHGSYFAHLESDGSTHSGAAFFEGGSTHHGSAWPDPGGSTHGASLFAGLSLDAQSPGGSLHGPSLFDTAYRSLDQSRVASSEPSPPLAPPGAEGEYPPLPPNLPPWYTHTLDHMQFQGQQPRIPQRPAYTHGHTGGPSGHRHRGGNPGAGFTWQGTVPDQILAGHLGAPGGGGGGNNNNSNNPDYAIGGANRRSPDSGTQSYQYPGEFAYRSAPPAIMTRESDQGDGPIIFARQAAPAPQPLGPQGLGHVTRQQQLMAGPMGVEFGSVGFGGQRQSQRAPGAGQDDAFDMCGEMSPTDSFVVDSDDASPSPS